MNVSVKTVGIQMKPDKTVKDVKSGELFTFCSDEKTVGGVGTERVFIGVWFDNTKTYEESRQAYHFMLLGSPSTWAGSKDSPVCKYPVRLLSKGAEVTLTVL